MIRPAFLIACCWFSLSCTSRELQPEETAWVSIHVSETVSNQEEPLIRQAIQLWERYLNERVIRLQTEACWSAAERKKYAVPDQLIIAKIRSYDPELSKVKPTLVSARRMEDSLVVLKTFFAKTDSNQYATPVILLDAHVRPEGDSLRLFRPLEWNTRHWLQRKVGDITYQYKPEHSFNDSLAQALDGFSRQLSGRFHIGPLAFDYYLYDSTEELFRMNGFDYEPLMFTEEQTGGMAETYNGILHAANGAEWYPHEVVHLYARDAYPERHYWLEEGLATYLGGSVGQPLEWHLKRIARHLDAHPELPWGRPWELTKMDDTTDLRYAIAGLFMKLADEKEGQQGIDHLMLQSGRDDGRSYQVLEAYFDTGPEGLGHFIQQKLGAYR